MGKKKAAGKEKEPKEVVRKSTSAVSKKKKDDDAFEEDFANFLGHSHTTDEEEEDEEEEEPFSAVHIGPASDKEASSFWKTPEIPDKYPLDHVNVENLVNMLSKIRLVWPEDLPGYDEMQYSTEPERAKFPVQFYHNSDKEKVVLWHAENFRRQFLHKFPDRRPLVIAPRNECGCQKLFPTYISPTAIGYPEFLDCVTTVEFLKDFFTPALLNPPTKFPERIRSHPTVIKKRNANAFEMCIIAVSSLIGSGYNAYIVDGYVSKTLSTIDTTEDYHEPPEKPILTYEVPSSPEKTEMNAFEHSFDYSFLMETREEAPVPTVSPSKYRFKKKGEGEGAALAGNPVPDIPIVEESESIMDLPMPAGHEATPSERNLEGDEMDENEADDMQGEDDGEEEEGEGEAAEATTVVGSATEMEEEGEDDEEEEEEEQELSEPDEELPSFAKDRYHGKRTHAWILIMPGGQHDVDKPFFLEPFSGTWRALKDPNFLGIEAVFNHKNYWINIQPPVKNLRKLNYNLDNPSAWSSLLVEPDYKRKKRVSKKGASMFQDDDDDDASKVGEFYLTMPVSWTPDMEVSQEEYDMKYPNGKKTIEYNDAIVELAAPYVNDDGLVRKVLKFTGPSRDPEDLEYIEENFEHRKDKLVKRKWFREGKLLHEYFEPGRKDALKEHVHVSGRNKPDYPRDLFYYPNAHRRSVSHRRIIKKGMIEHFEDREDKLYYKITLFGGLICNTIPTKDEENRSKARGILELVKGAGAGGGGGKKRARRKITKIVEKYARSEEKEPTTDIAEKHMCIDEGRLRILFHYTPGNLTRNTLEFYKGVKPGQSKYAPVEYRPEDCIEYQADREAEAMNVYKKFTLLQQMDRDERSSSVYSREAEDEIYQTVTGRVQEDWRHEIEPDAFAGDRNEEYLKMMREVQPGEEGEEEIDLTETDFATPFFEKYGYPRNNREEILMKKRIMLHEKVKILRRAYMIKEMYDKESALLREKQDWYTRHIDQMNQTQEEDFSHMYKERLFQMHILEQRMFRHQQETPRQYYNLLVQVLRHPQLNRFNKKVPPPPPPMRELTEAEKARIAKELAKLKDCCQFYSVRYEEPRRSRGKNQAKQRGSKDELDGDEGATGSSEQVTSSGKGSKSTAEMSSGEAGEATTRASVTSGGEPRKASGSQAEVSSEAAETKDITTRTSVTSGGEQKKAGSITTVTSQQGDSNSEGSRMKTRSSVRGETDVAKLS